jgi:alpha-beta hydrolase superfamily lysophospholipase
MHAWLFRNNGSKDVILYCIGRTSCISNCLENVAMLLKSGYSVFIFEYRGFGESEGKAPSLPSVESICQDGIFAFDYLVYDLKYRAEHITVYGESLGAGVAAHITQTRPMSGLILQSGFASMKRIGEHMMPFLKVYPKWLYPKVHLDTERTLSKAHPPLLILHGQRDEVIPYEHAEILYKAARGIKRLVCLPHSMHRFIWHTDQELYVNAVSEFRQSLEQKEVAA